MHLFIAIAIFAGLVAYASLAPPSVAADTYEVQPGDSASAIAARLGVPTHLLIALNPQIESPNLLFVGQILTVPDGYGLPEGSVPTAPPAAAQLVHTVQAGETLSTIADRYGVSTADLLLLNPGLSPDLIFIGAQIVVLSEGGVSGVPGPAPPAVVDPAPAFVSYRVQPGDTYSAIAARFGLSQAELFALNPTVPPNDVLFVDDVLLVPAVAAAAPVTGDPLQALRAVHVVEPGDTAIALAQQYGLTLAELLVLNPGLNPELLGVGQVLVVPGTAAPVTGDPLQALRAVHVVEPGDTAIALAQQYGLTLAELLVLNPGLNPELLGVGQVLVVPGTAAPVTGDPLQAPRAVHVVEPGDTAIALAQQYGLTLAELLVLNPGLNPELLGVGQALIVPDTAPHTTAVGADAGAGALTVYTIQAGDTLSEIADRGGFSIDSLLAINPGINPDLITPGASLFLPTPPPPPISYSTVIVETSDFLEYVAADIGVLPETLLANNPGIDPGEIIGAGTALTIPDIEGVVITVQPGDTLAGIAAIQGSTVDAILTDPRNVGLNPTALVVGQQIVVPIATPFFVWPTEGEISDYFGICRWECTSRHNGLDIATTAGSDIRAIAGGIVTFSGGTVCCGLGLYVEIDHGNGWVSRYGHLAYLGTVVVGQFVGQGEVIGAIGCTGLCTGPHLHLELVRNDWLLDPLNYLP